MELVTVLFAEEAVPLLTAFVHRRAETAGLRALALKGPIADADGLRPPRASGDVDVLVPPEDAPRLVALLAGDGWTERPWPDAPTLAQKHSRSYRHPDWPVDIDVHWRWPGFLAPAAEAFESLWNRRRTVEIAGRPVATVGVADMALILALHSLRDAWQITDPRRTGPSDYELLVDAVAARPALHAPLRDAAESLGAVPTAAPFLHALGVPARAGEAPADQLRAWRLGALSRHAAAGWVEALRAAPAARRPALLRRALFPSGSALRAADPSIGPRRRDAVAGWWRRFRRGVRTAPEAWRLLRQADHGADRTPA
ncbi:putative nucleotidyltransferase-like protein [Rathayibacter sp. PhB151]|uniref:nucleotidyltransferase family protein n=1 Tax=Rathayibacter sp. PhB151 TaxID=2485189 RepID=UPI0010635FC3|nr:nucleotidyltransferase family protein [Rathayibacter sp. PhB151]TDX81163.1 putative nucleotidyltransferase-like protein [Rathayibacter sp. PhB151]